MLRLLDYLIPFRVFASTFVSLRSVNLLTQGHLAKWCHSSEPLNVTGQPSLDDIKSQFSESLNLHSHIVIIHDFNK